MHTYASRGPVGFSDSTSYDARFVPKDPHGRNAPHLPPFTSHNPLTMPHPIPNHSITSNGYADSFLGDDSAEHSRRELLRQKLRDSERKLSQAVHTLQEPSGTNYGSTSTNSYQNAAPIPRIHHYEDDQEPQPSLWQKVRAYTRADASLRPNNGQTNSYDDALFGLALHELLQLQRWSIIGASLAAISLTTLSLLARTLTMQLSQLVLSAYLALLSFFLLLNELLSFWRVPAVHDFVQRNVGILHRPSGKICYLFFLSTLCVAVGGLAETVVAAVYGLSAMLLLVVYCTNEELRETEATEDHRSNGSDTHVRPTPSSRSWSYFSSSSTGVFDGAVEETDTLLQR